MIKPVAVSKGYTGPILNMIHENGFKIKALKMLRLTVDEAQKFYAVHKGRPFYEGLIEFMTSGPIVAAILEADNAVERYRELLGPTDPSSAKDGTIRKKYANSLQQNAVHGSDSDENAIIESNFFFSDKERF